MKPFIPALRGPGGGVVVAPLKESLTHGLSFSQ